MVTRIFWGPLLEDRLAAHEKRLWPLGWRKSAGAESDVDDELPSLGFEDIVFHSITEEIHDIILFGNAIPKL